MATLPRDIMPFKRLNEKVRKNIGESTECFEASDDNRLEPGDIWRRIMRNLEVLGCINKALNQLEGQKLTVIVAGGLSNACAVLRLMYYNAHGATVRSSDLRLLELYDTRTLRLARLSRNT